MNIVLDKGTLRYSSDFKLVIVVDPGIAEIARALIPPHFQAQPTRWPAHITGVRNEVIPVYGVNNFWGKYEGEEVDFLYSTKIHHDETYFWYEVACGRLQEIRAELGLPCSSQWTRPPNNVEMLHITVANRKQALK